MKAKKMSQRINIPVIARNVKMESLNRLAKKKNQTKKKKVVLVKIMRKNVKMNVKEKMKKKKKERKKVKNQMRKTLMLRKNKK